MKKTKLISVLLTAVLAVQALASAVSAKLVTGVSGELEERAVADTLSIPAQSVKGNRLPLSSFDVADCVINWAPYSHHTVPRMRLEWRYDENGGYLRATDRVLNYFGYEYTPLFTYTAGTYKFTGYFRTYYEGEVTSLRLEFVDDFGNQINQKEIYINCGNDWVKVEYYLEVPDTMKKINICGAGHAQYIQDFCMDEFSMVKIDSIPEGYTNPSIYGIQEMDHEAVLEQTYKIAGYSDWEDADESKYKVNGIMLNNDADGTLYSIGTDPESVSVQDIIDLVMQYEGSQVTDMMICVCNEIATYPSLVWTSYLDKYYQKDEAGVEVDWSDNRATKAAQYLWEELSLDYVGLWCELLPEIGINPWISYRMNDAHERNIGVSVLMSEFFHENPQYYRVKHHNYVSYMDKIYDYTHPEVRDHYLALINESLSRYNCYGIDLDFQREAFLWYIGGEYNGLDILNQFMRDVEDVVAIYEEKYGHEIKIAVRVPSDPMTCYELGMDVVTWAAEGIIDHVTAGGRFEVTDTDIPIRLWDSLLEPHGVTLAASLDVTYLRHDISSAQESPQTLEMVAGIAANAYSQGADKIYYYNSNTAIDWDGPIKDDDKISITRDGNFKGYSAMRDNTGRWLVLNTIGSYDKVIEMNRRAIPTFNDTKAPWVKDYKNQILPCRIYTDTTQVFRIPVGDITVGSTVTFMISGSTEAYLNPPTVYVNSEPCKFVGVGDCLPTKSGTFTEDKVMMYEIPVEAHDESYMVIEISSPVEFWCSHMEILVEAPVH
ncbi:MAG: hypothetical protein IJY93_07975 [Clostridia bacterium]|nr:hypothetical protein [Clostridia bacterium]